MDRVSCGIFVMKVACNSCNWWHHIQCVSAKEEQPTNYYGQPFICRTRQMEDDSDDSDSMPTPQTLV
ncbi:hypothetical protein LSH36_581g01023 [Paralvinella palmiformis]|uniref:Uncharacterized protein n=1 Tax=Paralvinella palmiformis TaxID=53620 RepID=A0AAD9MXR7_9ANNE|nr:hypothetical protein LSH36_581g01023 [Paralvinella palmiformis]